MAQRTKAKAAVLGTALTIGLMAVLSVVFFGKNAQAGRRLAGDPLIGPLGWSGSMNAVRWTGDSEQFIRSELIGQDNGTTEGVLKVRLTWREPGATSNRMCVSSHPAIIAAAAAIGDAYVSLLVDPITGNCSSLIINASSEYSPKQP